MLSSVGNMDDVIQETYTSSSGNVNMYVSDTTARARTSVPWLWSSIVTFRGQLRISDLIILVTFDEPNQIFDVVRMSYK